MGGRTNGVGGGREAGAAPCELEGSICGSASGAPSGGTSSGASAGEASGESSTPGPDASPTSPPVTDASEPLDSTPNEAGPEDVSIDVPKVIAVPGEAGPDKVVYSATQAKNVASPLPGSGKGITYDGQGLWISQDTSLVRFNQGTTDRTLTLGLTPPRERRLGRNHVLRSSHLVQHRRRPRADRRRDGAGHQADVRTRAG